MEFLDELRERITRRGVMVHLVVIVAIILTAAYLTGPRGSEKHQKSHQEEVASCLD